MTPPATTARMTRNRRLRSSSRWSTSDMTVSSPGAAVGGGAGSGVAGTPVKPASRRASASAIYSVGCRRPSWSRASARWTARWPTRCWRRAARAAAPRRSPRSRRAPRELRGSGRGSLVGRRRGRVDLRRVLDIRGRLAELADALAERRTDVRQLAGADDQQRDDEDDDQFEGARGRQHSRSLLRGPLRSSG